MSLFAASSAASRHLRRHLLAGTNSAAASHLRIGGASAAPAPSRAFSSKAAGSGLRRTKPSGGRRPASSRPKASQPSAAAGEEAVSDPHAIANEMVRGSAEGRTPGTESVATLTNEQKMSNFAMAGGLLAFVSYIFYYSLSSVGGDKNAKALLFGEDAPKEGETTATPGFEEFLKEANEGRSLEEQRVRAESQARGEARELAELESSTAARLKAEGVDAAIVGAASAEEEREMARAAGFVEGGGEKKRRPLWKRVVFFWRRE
ncbi:hypothetical protein ACHAXT_009909 [Thalassiosira profunda]